MKYLLIGLVCAWACTMAHAVLGAPFINSDAEATLTADTCVCQEGTGPLLTSPTVSGKCRVDVASITAGAHVYQCWFNSSLWAVPGLKGSITVKKPVAFPAPTLDLGL